MDFLEKENLRPSKRIQYKNTLKPNEKRKNEERSPHLARELFLN